MPYSSVHLKEDGRGSQRKHSNLLYFDTDLKPIVSFSSEKTVSSTTATLVINAISNIQSDFGGSSIH